MRCTDSRQRTTADSHRYPLTENRQLTIDESQGYRHIIKTACIFGDHLDHLTLAPPPGPFLSANLDHLARCFDHLTPRLDYLTLAPAQDPFLSDHGRSAERDALVERLIEYYVEPA